MKKFFLLLLTIFCFPMTVQARSHRHSSGGGGNDSDAMLRVLSSEDRRSSDRYLINALHHPSKRVVKAAMLALGRIGDTSALDELTRVFNHRDNDLKKTAAFALSLMPDDTALKILVQNIPMQKDPEVLASLYSAVGRLGNERNVPSLAAALMSSNSESVQRSICEALGVLWSGASEKWEVPTGILQRLIKLTEGSNEEVDTACAFALARFKGDPNLVTAPEVLEALARAPKRTARPLLLRVFSRNRTPAATAALLQEVANSDVVSNRVEATKSLATHSMTDAVQEAFKKLLTDSNATVVVQALESIAYHGASGAPLTTTVDAVFSKSSRSPWVRGIALKALMTINPTVGHTRVNETLAKPDSPVLLWAVSALAIAPSDADLARLTDFVNHENYRVAEEAIDGLSNLSEDKFTPAMKASLKKALERGDAALAALVSQLVEKYKWKDFAPSLATVYPLFTQADQIEPKTAILSALGAVGDHSHEALLENALKDSERSVSQAAADALKAITGRDESAKVPANSRSLPLAFTHKDLLNAATARVLIKTNRGEIEMHMLETAPLASMNFLRLAKKHFYDGKTFHRVVPNFVVQGGDPRGDGYGSAGYLIRDELTSISHTRGIVGMATAGRDTGGCQFFVNTAANFHLDGKYTAFAEVTRGMDVVEKLEVGDKITSAVVLP